MKTFARILMVLLTCISVMVCCSLTALAEDYYDYRNVDHVTEEIINGVMTGELEVIGTIRRAVGYARCSIPTQEWFGYGKCEQAFSYSAFSYFFSDTKVTWQTDIQYYTQYYSYMGSGYPRGSLYTVRNGYCIGNL